MRCLVFDCDDIAFGDNRAMVTTGRRRFLLSRLSAEHLAILRTIRPGQPIELTDTNRALVELLHARGLVSEQAGTAGGAPAGRPGWRPVIPSGVVTAMARPLRPLSTAPALALLAALALALLVSGAARPLLVFSVTRWVEQTSLAEFLLAGLVFTGCIVAHELGHAAACLRLTGLVGEMRARLYRGIPVFTTDVSSLCLTDRRGRALIAVAGIAIQVCLSMLLLLVDHPAVRIGASLSLLSAMFALVPLPGSDGYWFLSDWFQVRIAGLFGANGRRDWIGATFTVWLVAITGLFTAMLLRDARALALHARDLVAADPAWALLFAAIGLYTMAIALLFAWRTARFLLTAETRI